MTIYHGHQAHGKAVMSSIQSAFSPVTMQVISREENGELYGGVIYENYTGAGGSLLAHVAGFRKNWLNRDMLYIMFDYPFKQLGCRAVFLQVASNNEASLRFAKSLGFKEYVVLEDVFPDADMILLKMKREECRFLNVKPRTVFSRRTDDGKAESTEAARL
ncbi:N-acyltransferase protein [Rhizobium phage RHph_TM3_14A]|nr:N-acyltransferase protein [Rhizobium phage RHph_TM27A]QIG67008.1 N-acyltransferase protein [Rhizobium phage RHph_TM27B]QIG67096.1 N-acyltransferase protein [Rhizobium phage RHph_TM29]QIG67552.1 N-acyltransferase protein [Rhizobium phage RHph_TM3_14A]